MVPEASAVKLRLQKEARKSGVENVTCAGRIYEQQMHVSKFIYLAVLCLLSISFSHQNHEALLVHSINFA